MPPRRIFPASIAAALLVISFAADAQPPANVPAPTDSTAASAPVTTPDPTPGVDSKDPATVPVLAPLIADSERLTALNDPNRFTKPRFLTHDKESGLDAWFMANTDNEPKIVYTNPAGTVIIGGRLFAVNPANPKGELVYLLGQHTLAAMAVLASEGKLPPSSTRTGQSGTSPATSPTASVPPPPAPAPAQTSTQAPSQPQTAQLKGSVLLAEFDGATWVESGTNPAAPLLYAVVDPECPVCHAFTSTIWPDIEAGRVRVRWILSAPLAGGNGGKSYTSATAILALPPDNRSTAWIDHVERRKLPSSDAAAQKTALMQVSTNEHMRMRVLDANGLQGVPVLLYRSKDGKLGYRFGIQPSDVPSLIQTLGPLHTGS